VAGHCNITVEPDEPDFKIGVGYPVALENLKHDSCFSFLQKVEYELDKVGSEVGV
jgi:hypothetical protein